MEKEELVAAYGCLILFFCFSLFFFLDSSSAWCSKIAGVCVRLRGSAQKVSENGAIFTRPDSKSTECRNSFMLLPFISCSGCFVGPSDKLQYAGTKGHN